MTVRIVEKIKPLLLAEDEVPAVEGSRALMPATIVPSLDHASDYVVMHEEGILQRPPWLSQPLCLVLSDTGKKGGRRLDVPRRTVAAH